MHIELDDDTGSLEHRFWLSLLIGIPFAAATIGSAVASLLAL